VASRPVPLRLACEVRAPDLPPRARPGARFAPDGRSVIYASYMEGRPVELFSMQPGRPESTRPLGFPSTGLLAIATNGEMAVSTNCSHPIWGGGCRGTLGEMNVAGGAPREILENVSFADWTPDGKQLAVITGLAANGNQTGWISLSGRFSLRQPAPAGRGTPGSHPRGTW